MSERRGRLRRDVSDSGALVYAVVCRRRCGVLSFASRCARPCIFVGCYVEPPQPAIGLIFGLLLDNLIYDTTE